jgi:hypothetical protein
MIMFDPVIVRFENLDALKKVVNPNSHYQVSTVAGTLNGFRIKNGSRIIRRGVPVGKGWADAHNMMGGL